MELVFVILNYALVAVYARFAADNEGIAKVLWIICTVIAIYCSVYSTRLFISHL